MLCQDHWEILWKRVEKCVVDLHDSTERLFFAQITHFHSQVSFYSVLSIPWTLEFLERLIGLSLLVDFTDVNSTRQYLCASWTCAVVVDVAAICAMTVVGLATMTSLTCAAYVTWPAGAAGGTEGVAATTGTAVACILLLYPHPHTWNIQKNKTLLPPSESSLLQWTEHTPFVFHTPRTPLLCGKKAKS